VTVFLRPLVLVFERFERSLRPNYNGRNFGLG
jgi:hypothetical protein